MEESGFIYGIAIAVFMLLTGAIVGAILHGIGFSLFGFKEIKPSYKKRYLMQLVAGVISALLIWGITEVISDENLLALLTHDTTYIWLGGSVFVSVLFYISLSLTTHILVAKADWKVAFLSPVFETGVSFVLLLVLHIFMVFGTKQ